MDVGPDVNGRPEDMREDEVSTSGDYRVSWQLFSVNLLRSRDNGFGIGISGGKDNPNLARLNDYSDLVVADPSIIVTDVLPRGPAANIVKENDRIIAVNGVSLENVDYITAVNVMKSSDRLNMIVKRRIPLPCLEYEQRTLKFTLSKSRKKDDFGIVLGCKFYIKEINNPKLAEKEPGLKENDNVLRINGQLLEGLSLDEATRLLQRSREKLSLVVQRDVKRGTAGSRWPSQTTVYERLGSVPITPRQSPIPATYHHDAHVSRKDDMELGKRYSEPIGSEYFNQHPTPSQNALLNRGRTSSQTPSTCSSPRLNHFPIVPQASSVITDNSEKPGETVRFKKTGSTSLGIRVIGGNQVGIFVSAVQEDSPAAKNGIRVGCRLNEVNGQSFKGKTREEAVEMLLNLADDVTVKYENSLDDFYLVKNYQLGDSFYIRTLFSHLKKTMKNEVCFSEGDIFHVTDTLHNGSVGMWQVQKVYSSLDQDQKPEEMQGVIPNARNADVLAKQETADYSTISRTLFRKRVGPKKIKPGDAQTKAELGLPAYERVVLKKPAFKRPLVIFGPLADVARQLLLTNFRPYFQAVDEDGPIRISAINRIIESDKHCVLNIGPCSVEKLQAAQYAPIVILIDVDSRSRIRELRAKAGVATISARKLLDYSTKIKKHYSHLLTATLDALKEDGWFDALRMLIVHLQDRRVWIPEVAHFPADEVVLFPNLSEQDDISRSDYGVLGTKSPTESPRMMSSLTSTPMSGHHNFVYLGDNELNQDSKNNLLNEVDPCATQVPVNGKNKNDLYYQHSNGDNRRILAQDQAARLKQPEQKPPSNGVPYIDDQDNNAAPETTSSPHKVIDEVYAVLDWNGGTVRCPESGVELILPAMALSFGKSQKLFIKVIEEQSQSDEDILSPIVTCGPQGLQFNRPVELRLPYKANRDPKNNNILDGMTQFVLKTGSENTWKNIELLEPPVQNTQNNYISVFTDHF
uniref:Tight junction protein ZO-1 n=2 Tax=Bursaphelenchus xylophilus TaxID=6326 RepID=A0A1I7S7E3_BURXY